MGLAKPAWPILQRGDALSVGLVGAWPFYEGAGNRLADLAGIHSGTLSSSVVWSPRGPAGLCLSFDNTSPGTVSLATGTIAATLANSTTAIWFNTTLRNTGQGRTLYAERAASGQDIFKLDFGDVGSSQSPFLTWRNDGGSLSQIRPANNNYGDGQWHHFVVTIIGTAVSLYIDGNLATTGTISTKDFTDAGLVSQMGTDAGDGNANFGGLLDGLLIYRRALSAAEIAQLYFDSFAIYRPKRRVPWFTVAGGAGTQNLAPGLFTNTNIFYAPIVAAGPVALTPGLFTDPDTFYAPTVTPGAVALAPSLFINPNTFYSPTITVAGAQALAPSLFINNSIFYLPIVRSRIILINVWVRLTEPHEFDARVWPKDTVFGPDQATVPSDFNYTPLMEGYSAESQAAVAQVKIDVWGRYDSHGNLLDNPPIPRPIYDPQPTPPVGNKHLLPLGNTC